MKKKNKRPVENQLGLSELVISQFGTEKQLMVADEERFHFAMRIDEVEEILEVGSIAALAWLNSHFDDKGMGLFLRDVWDSYLKAGEIYNRTGKISDIELHIVDGMQYVYCYVKKVPINKQSRKDAVEFFMNEPYKPNDKFLTNLIVAFGIRFLILGMIEQKVIS